MQWPYSADWSNKDIAAGVPAFLRTARKRNHHRKEIEAREGEGDVTGREEEGREGGREPASPLGKVKRKLPSFGLPSRAGLCQCDPQQRPTPLPPVATAAASSPSPTLYCLSLSPALPSEQWASRCYDGRSESVLWSTLGVGGGRSVGGPSNGWTDGMMDRPKRGQTCRT